jgi:transcriptional regulator with XRE-family HTH domain
MNARREQVRELLRAARARIEPNEVGLPGAQKRRSPGLRREDVAVLAAVSVKWYTWLEQGREINFSTDVLERVATVLRLSGTERSYFFALAQWRQPPRNTSAPALSETFWQTIQFVPVPVLVMSLRWDILAWNPLLVRVFRDYAAVPEAERNLLRIVLTDRKYRDDPAYDTMIRRLIGEFRVDFGQCAGDPAFEDLIAELKHLVPDFDRRWRNVEFCNGQRVTVVRHQDLGDLTFDRVSYVVEGSAALRVVMFVPFNSQTARTVAGIYPVDHDDTLAPFARRDGDFDGVHHSLDY